MNIRKHFPLLLIAVLLSACGSSNSVSSNDSINEDSSTSINIEDNSQETSYSSENDSRYDIDPTAESLYSNQHYLNYVGNLQDVWDDYRGDDVTIAVIDSGFHYNHNEFKFADGTSKISEKSAYLAKNKSPVVGIDKVGITDGDSHGTICATVAAASCTGEGTVGVAPNAKLMLLKVDKTKEAIASAFRYAADNGARAISISLGEYNNNSSPYDIVDTTDLNVAFDAACKYAHDKGVVICSAAGNGGYSERATEYTYPGATEFVIGCGGLADRSRTSRWGGSSYNSEKKYQFVDVFAPAENLYSGCYFDDKGVHYDYDGGFEGTSFAAPIVAGAAALYFDKYPSNTNTDFERALFNTCDPFGSSVQNGYGAINIKKLLNYEKPADADKDFYFKAASWWSADNASTYAFAWNYGLTSVNADDFPGVKMTALTNGYYKINIDTSIYSWLIFSRYSSDGTSSWNAQTIDIEISQFGNKNCFNLSSSPTWYDESGGATGTFSTYTG